MLSCRLLAAVDPKYNKHFPLNLRKAFRDKEKKLEERLLKAGKEVGLRLRVECDYEAVFDAIKADSRNDLAQTL